MLQVVSPQEASKIMKEKFCSIKIGKETVSLSESLGRILGEDILSKENVPNFKRSTVDGFAVKSRDTFGSSESMPAQLQFVGEISMGEETNLALEDGTCAKVSTGGMLPEGADAVVMVEYTDLSFSDFCLIFKAVSPFENVTKIGDDVKENTLVLKKGTYITPLEIGTLAAMGITKVVVSKKPKVGILSTGDELVEIEKTPSIGKVRDINSHMLSAFVESLGCESQCYGIIEDDFSKLFATVQKAAQENDVLLLSGGSSAGEKDVTVDIIRHLGEVYLHGIAMKPGKPTIIGKIGNTPVFGLPGHPMACYFVSLLFVRPLIDQMTGRIRKERYLEGTLQSNISSNHGRAELIPVQVTEQQEVIPVFSKSGIISVLSKCDGYICIERNCEGLKAGETVKVYLLGE